MFEKVRIDWFLTKYTIYFDFGNALADVIFGGSDDPTALGNLYSIGAITMESNGEIHASVSDLLKPFGVDTSRMYINFFDMPRANVGWNGKTFAG